MTIQPSADVERGRSILHERPRDPILLDHAFDDPDEVLAMVPRHAPYWPVMRYAAAESELESMSGPDVRFMVEPWFRGDWAGDAPPVEGVEALLANPRFLDSARSLFDAEVVTPRIVYVNLMAPMAYQATAHQDIPVFRGIEKPAYPVWLLHVMNRSGLFARWRIDIATAVAWFFEGNGGAFEYWADGPDAPPLKIEAPLSNRAVVSDNEMMFHRIGAIGAPGAALLEGASVEAELLPVSPEANAWHVVEDGRELMRYRADEIRISISWKAEVFASSEAARVRREGTDNLDLETVVDILVDALETKGTPIARPTAPLHDVDFVDRLNRLFPLPELTG